MQLNMSWPMIYFGKILQLDNKEKTLVMTMYKGFWGKNNDPVSSHYEDLFCEVTIFRQ